MKITDKVYNYIITSQPESPPESGGILGSKEGIICDCFLDDGLYSNRACGYIPNVKVLNHIIEQWQQMGVSFSGMFHTHFFGVSSLSKNDVSYIKKILFSMPISIKTLFFPIVVMPQRIIVSYIASRSDDRIIVTDDEIKIL